MGNFKYMSCIFLICLNELWYAKYLWKHLKSVHNEQDEGHKEYERYISMSIVLACVAGVFAIYSIKKKVPKFMWAFFLQYTTYDLFLCSVRFFDLYQHGFEIKKLMWLVTEIGLLSGTLINAYIAYFDMVLMAEQEV